MSDAVVVDLARLRRSCSQCTLRQLCLPAGIGAEDIDRLDRIVKRRRSIADKERLFSAGSELKTLYVAREGSFKTVVLSEDGQQHVIGFHLPGELMGLDALGAGRHRCDAVALEPAAVCEVPLDDLERVAAEVPGLQHQLLRVIGGSMGRDQDHMEMLGRRQASERVLLFLHGLAERYRALGHPEGLLVLSMSREDIANYLGLVIETVSRSFTRLQEDGVIAVRGRQVRVLDAVRFAGLAHEAAAAGGIGYRH
jgi:CRP/FNR family transcriptional regulator